MKKEEETGGQPAIPPPPWVTGKKVRRSDKTQTSSDKHMHNANNEQVFTTETSRVSFADAEHRQILLDW